MGRYKLLFVDESAFYLLPGVVRTWSPVGQTPVLRHKLTREHLSVISAVSPEGELFLQVREDAFDSDGIIGFLDTLQKQIEGNLVIVWDGAPIHRSRKIKEYLANGAAKRIHLERLPGYAPELNPDERLNADLKVAIGSRAPARTKAKLKLVTNDHRTYLTNTPDRVKSFFGDKRVKYAA